MDETRRKRFKRLGNRRINNVLNQLRVLGNLSNKSYYDYSEGDINKMFKAIESQLRATRAKFHFKRRRFKL